MSRKVMITGIGAVTPIGSGAQGLWEGVCRGKSAARRITRFDASTYPSQVAAEVDDFRPEEYFEPKRLRRLDRYAQFALASGMLAIKDADLCLKCIDPDRAGVTVGTAIGGAPGAELQHVEFLRGGLKAVNPALALSVFGGSGSCNLAMEFGFRGYTTANSDSCASGPIALGNALNAIRRGDTDVMLAGAVEAPLYPLSYGAFAIIHAMSKRNDDPATACRPFDKDRDGFVMAEGGAVLVLESEAHARDRGARIYAELAGFGLSNDAFSMIAPLSDGRQAARAMAVAMHDAGVTPADITYVNAHGSSTPLNEVSETRAIKLALGERAYQIPVSGTKGLHGHSLGATGAIEAAICALAIQNDWVPATANLFEAGEGLDLDYVPLHGRPARHNCVISNSFGFGGINSAIVLRNVA